MFESSRSEFCPKALFEENKFKGAINKLTNDILKKLDADGKADWVKQPVLASELGALIGYLMHKSGAD